MRVLYLLFPWILGVVLWLGPVGMMSLAGPGVSAAGAAPARPRVREVGGAGESPAAVRAELQRLRKKLARVDSLLDQVKDLHVRLVQLEQRLAPLERGTDADRELDRRLSSLSEDVARLGQRIERLQLDAIQRAAAPEEAPKGVVAGYKDGFYVGSGDRRYMLRSNGVLRTTFRVGEAVGSAALEPPEKVDLVSFGLPSGILMLGGNVFTKRLTYHIEMEIGPEGFFLYDFMFNYRPCEYFAVSAGQFLVHFSSQQVFDPYDILFVDSSIASLYYGVGRDIGVKLHFYQWKDRIFQEVGIFNGGGMNALENDNIDFMYTARAGVMPLGPVPDKEGDLRDGARPLRLLVAAGYMFLPMPVGARDLDADGVPDNAFVHQVAGELRLVWDGFAVNGEFYYRMEDRGAAVTELDPAEKQNLHRFGGFGQLSYFIRPIHLLVGARYGYAEPVAFWRRQQGALDHGWASPVGGVEGVPDRVHEAALTVVFFAFRQHLRLMANYSFFYEQSYEIPGEAGRPSRQVHMASLLVQARF